MEFEVVETYVLDGQRRYRLRVKGTNIVVNVAADTVEEAGEKAVKLLEKAKILEALRRRSGESPS